MMRRGICDRSSLNSVACWPAGETEVFLDEGSLMLEWHAGITSTYMISARTGQR